MIHPVDPDDMDTIALADTKEEAVARIRQIYRWKGETVPTIVIQRDYVPLWFGHLMKNTIFEFLAYKEWRD